jgi:predicted AAA+ superfamily ATPase
MNVDCTALALGLRSMVVFRALQDEPVVAALIDLLETQKNDKACGVPRMARFAAKLYEHGENLSDVLLDSVLIDDNLFTVRKSQGLEVAPSIEECAMQELSLLQKVSRLTPAMLREHIGFEGFLPSWCISTHDFTAAYHKRLSEIGCWGFGVFARHYAFVADKNGLVPIVHPDGVTLEMLPGYQEERRQVEENTKILLSGRSAANVLLYGESGTGKSSTVKAIVNRYRMQGLRLIELRRTQLDLIAPLLDELSRNPLKFILFIDDLSFSQDDENYAALKAALEGSISSKTDNVVIYATSNRRHLIKESFSDRDGDDIHVGDTIAEMTSLSDRFGLTITFSRPDKDLYLYIVSELAAKKGIAMPEDELAQGAETFALRRAGRSPRVAKQYIDWLATKI